MNITQTVQAILENENVTMTIHTGCCSVKGNYQYLRNGYHQQLNSKIVAKYGLKEECIDGSTSRTDKYSYTL